MGAFWVAMQFLTRLPVPGSAPPAVESVRRSLLYYPAVGALIGVPVWGIGAVFGSVDPLLGGALALAAWVLVTGGLHIDGLADAADGWVGGHGDRDRTLAIMKEPSAGPMGVAAVGVLLLIKFTALAVLLREAPALILLAPLLGRTAVVALLLTTPYVRPHGIGSALTDDLPRHGAVRVVGAVIVMVLLLFGIDGIWAVASSVAWVALFRMMLMGRIGGTTGDTAGALVETAEAVVLVVAATFV